MTDIASYARDYDRASAHLAQITALVEKGKGVETLRKLQIVIRARDSSDRTPGLEMLADAVAKAVQGDIERYVAVVVTRAQDAVTRAAAALREAIDRDLKQSNMRD